MNFIPKVFASKRPPTTSEKSTEKKTNTDPRPPLKAVVPRVKPNISLGGARRQKSNNNSPLPPSTARHRHNVELELPRYIEENPVIERQNHESLGSETGDDPNIISVPDYILENLPGSEPFVQEVVASDATAEDEINPGNGLTDSFSISSNGDSNSEDSLSRETRATKPARHDFIKGRRQPANLFDPRRQNYQKNNKTIDDVDIFAITAQNREKISALLPHMPPGMIVDGRGTVYGEHVHMLTPIHAHIPNMPIGQALSQDMASRHLNTTIEGAMPREIAGIKVINQCVGDYHRLVYKFPMGDGNFAELPWPSPEEVEARCQETNRGAKDKQKVKEDLRAEQIARRVLAFVQDDNATNEENRNAALVMSSLLHQGISTMMSIIAYGENPAFKIVSLQSAEFTGRSITIKDKNGDLKPQKTKGLGNITFTLSRRGDDFIIGADLPGYGEPRPGREDHVPLHVDGVIGIHAKMEMIVNGAKARNGELAVSIPDGVHVAYSGGFTF